MRVNDGVHVDNNCEAIFVNFGNGIVRAKLDSGADITVVRKDCIPPNVLNMARMSGDSGHIKLLGPFHNTECVAELIHIPCGLVGDSNPTQNGPGTVITCAVTEDLRENMLLTLVILTGF